MLLKKKIENFKEEKNYENMKKIFLGLIFFTLTTVSLAQSETEYHLERIGNQLMYSRIPHNDCYVSSVVAKDPIEFAKKIQEYTLSKNKSITKIWHSYNEEKQEYVAIIYYYIIK